MLNMIDVAAMVKEFAKVTRQTPTSHLYTKLLSEEYHEFLGADTCVEELKEMADLVYVTFGLADARGYDLTEAIERVHENNLGRITQPDGTIKRREDGKIIKNLGYPKVDLEDLV